MFVTRVEHTISAAHHNGPPGGRCHRNHGHEWRVVVEFRFDDDELDKYGWGPDFGAVKAVIEAYDHQDLNSYMEAPSAEHFAARLAEEIAAEINWTPEFVQVAEGKGNAVTYYPHPKTT